MEGDCAWLLSRKRLKSAKFELARQLKIPWYLEEQNTPAADGEQTCTRPPLCGVGCARRCSLENGDSSREWTWNARGVTAEVDAEEMQCHHSAIQSPGQPRGPNRAYQVKLTMLAMMAEASSGDQH